MVTDKIKAGIYGYIDYKKKKLGVFSAALAAFILALVISGLLIWGSVKNILILPALLLVIPFANFFSTFVALFKMKSPSIDKYNMLGHFSESGMLLSDLVIVDGAGKRYYYEFAIIHASGVCAFSETVIKDKYKPEVYINDLLKKRGLSSTFKTYNDFDGFLKTINGMKPLEDEKRLGLIKETITLCCM